MGEPAAAHHQRPGHLHLMAPRAGIVITGTEVISGVIADPNGPWVAERLAERGVQLAHIMVVADRREDLRAALRLPPREGMDLILTSGGLGPTADDLTAEVVADFAGREMRLDEALEEHIAEILARLRARLPRPRRGGGEGRPTASRRWSPRARGARPGRDRAGLVVPADGGVVVVLPGPAARAAADVETALGPGRCARAGRATPLRGYTLRMFGVPESEIAKSLREIEADGVAIDAVEITTCLRRGEIEIDVRLSRRAADGRRRGARGAVAERHARALFSLDGETIDSQVAELLAGRRTRDGRVLQRRPDGGADHRTARVLRLHRRRHRRLLERGEGGAARCRPGADRAKGAVSPEVA